MNNQEPEETHQMENLTIEPLVEIMKYSKVEKGDVLILRCERGKEYEEIKNMHSALKLLIQEKDLRILAMTPDQDMENLYLHIEAAKNFRETEMEQSTEVEKLDK
jgi:hypothetical protein